VPAALFMMSSRTLLKGAAIGTINPGEALREVNELLYEENETMMFVTVLYSIYNPETGRLTYSNGGHDAPMLVRPDGSSELLALTGGVALGIAPDIEYPSHTVQLEPGDTVLLYTDGITEAMNGDGEQFGVKRMHEVFAANAPENSEQAAKAMFEAVKEFVGETPQSDDITCLVLRRDEDGS
jgi:sigma-B regulation protein RsbU (phosphoserine phosphatase)